MYIHYSFEHYSQSGIPQSLRASNEIISAINKKKNSSIRNFSDKTFEGVNLLSLLTKNGELNRFLTNIVSNIDFNENISEGISPYAAFETATIKSINEVLNKTGKGRDIDLFKNSLEKYLVSIGNELGYKNYNELCKAIVTNISLNYGCRTEEKEMIQDFLADVNNSKFMVNKQYEGKLTGSLNKLFLTVKSLPTLSESKKSLEYKSSIISMLGEKSICWLEYCGGILKEIALYHEILKIKHEIAIELNNILLNKDKKYSIEPTKEISNFIKENIGNVPQIKNKTTKGISISNKDSNYEMEISVNLPNVSGIKKGNKNTRKIKKIQDTVNFIDNISVIDKITTEGVLNLSGGHVFNSTDNKNMSNFFNQLTLNIGKNLVLSELTSDDDSYTYIIGNKPVSESDLIAKVMNSNNSVNVKIKMDRQDIVQDNQWVEGHGSRWDNARYRSVTNAGYQYTNLMQYEFDIANNFF